MNDTISSEFPFVETLPKKEVRKLSGVELIQLFKALFSQHGSLLPAGLVCKFLGLSKQRVSQLVADGRLVVKDIEGHKFITEDSVVAFSRSERKTGRPPKIQTASDVWKASREYMAKE